jgi:cell division protein FtsB
MTRLFKSKFFLLLEIVILILAINGFIKISAKKKSIQTEINNLEGQVEKAGQENLVLSRQLKQASSDSYQEMQAKRSLNYRKPDETVFVLYEDPLDQRGGKSVSKEEVNSHASNPVLWWRYFFGADDRI